MRRPKYMPETAEVRVQKNVHFTVSPINNIEDWRKEREKIEAQYHKEKLERFQKARASAMAIVSGDKQVELLSAMDKAEIAYRKSRDEAKAPTVITLEMIEAKKAGWDRKNEEVKKQYAWMNVLPEEPVAPRPSLYERFKRAVFRFVSEAFPQ